MASAPKLIGIDTNVLARYLVQDDPVQSVQATQFLESLDQHTKGYVCIITLVELVWLLRRTYKQSRLQVGLILEELLATQTLVFEHRDCILSALAIYQNTSADLSDLLISQINQQANCTHTVTFDKGAVNKACMISL